jgi:predicted nucleic acid-binding protein
VLFRSLAESEGYLLQLSSILQTGRVSGPQVHDARVAALCRHHGVTELWTADRDFGRFPRLKAVNPLLSRVRS